MLEISVTSICVLLIVIANWKIFTKAGKPGWHSLIPIYNIYEEYAICWKGSVGIFVFILLTAIGAAAQAIDDPLVFAIPVALAIILQIVFYYKLARSYGKGLFTMLLLIFTAGLGRMILGFGRAKYLGRA